jgi:4-hydroxy-tetrahydrodipicolinate synthase
MAQTCLRGVIAATPTPVLDDHTPDTERLARHCRRVLEEGCDGINLLGTTGEANSFSVSQRLRVMESIAAAGLPMTRFMVGTGVCSIKESIQLTQAAADLGYAGALVLPPFYYPDVGAAALEAYMDELIARVARPALPLYLYHIPQNTRVGWPVECVAGLKRRHPAQLAGLKDSSGDLAYSRAIVREVPDFDVFPSNEGTLLHASQDGFAGCISATTNITAADAQAAWRAPHTAIGQQAGARAVAQRGVLARQALVASVKAALALRYDDEGWARTCPPLMPRSPAEIQALGRELEECAA